ncbi:MAG: hypothetical protein ACJ71W_10830 [Terriglobales bacterium]
MSAAPQMGAMAPSLTSKFKFAWLLPVAELLLCAALLWPVRLVVFQGLGIPLPHMLQQTMLPDYFRWASKRDFFLTSVAALNIPAEAIQLPYAVFTPSKQEWVPQGVDFRVWRVVTWPLLCIPFWWVAGRAIDALVAVKSVRFAPRIGWPETIIGFILMAAFGTAFCGLVFGLPKEDISFELTRFVAGCGLWVLLGAISVVARFRQWRLLKLQKAAATAATA